MKSTFFMAILCFFLKSSAAIALGTYPQIGPSVPFSPEMAVMLFGRMNPDNPNGELNCRILVAHSWPYTNSQVTPLCTDAEVACLRYGLLHQNLRSAKRAKAETLKKNIAASYADVMLRLLGCVLAIEATATTNSSLVEAAGFDPASAEENRP
jgi:hypothetical protein